MTNEELVKRIRGGSLVSDSMQLLYEKNLPLIKQCIKPYAAYEPMEDLLQESYFGLYEAVQHYETSENVLFMTYAPYWIRQAVIRYIEKCGSTVKIPGNARQKITKYKKAVEKLARDRGADPADSEVAAYMGISVKQVQDIKSYMQSVVSLDTPLTGNEDMTITDTLQADFSVEDETIDKIYAEHSKNELWGIVEHYTSDRENQIIREYFINNKPMAQIAREQELSLGRIRQIKEKGLRRLRMGKARRELSEKFDIVEAGAYRGGLNSYREHDFTSIVEYMAIKRQDAQEEYERHLREVEEMHRERTGRKT
jgi:RNA polymerase primary sigma factor